MTERDELRRLQADALNLPIDLDEKTIDEFAVAQVLEVSIDEVRKMRRDKRGPAYIAIVRDVVRYYPHVVEAYAEAVINEHENFPHGF